MYVQSLLALVLCIAHQQLRLWINAVTFALYYYKNWQSLPFCFLNSFQKVVSFHPRNFNLWYCTSDGLQKVYITPFKHGHFRYLFTKVSPVKYGHFDPFWVFVLKFFGGTPKIDFKHFWKISFFPPESKNQSLKSEDCRPGGWPNLEFSRMVGSQVLFGCMNCSTYTIHVWYIHYIYLHLVDFYGEWM